MKKHFMLEIGIASREALPGPDKICQSTISFFVKLNACEFILTMKSPALYHESIYCSSSIIFFA